MTTDAILQNLKQDLNEERYEHSIGVAEKAKELAEKFGCDPEKAYIAGLLHDCAKCMDFELSKKIALEHTPDLDETEKDNKKTIHAPVSAYIAKEKYGVTDAEILSAIRLHTIGKCQMTDFEKIIFIFKSIYSISNCCIFKISSFNSVNFIRKFIIYSFKFCFSCISHRSYEQIR